MVRRAPRRSSQRRGGCFRPCERTDGTPQPGSIQAFRPHPSGSTFPSFRTQSQPADRFKNPATDDSARPTACQSPDHPTVPSAYHSTCHCFTHAANHPSDCPPSDHSADHPSDCPRSDHSADDSSYGPPSDHSAIDSAIGHPADSIAQPEARDHPPVAPA